MDTARIYANEYISVKFSCNVICLWYYLAVDFKPNVTLGTPLNDGPCCHQTNNEGLSLFDSNVHLFSGVRASQKVPRGNHTGRDESISAQSQIAGGLRTLGRRISPRTPGILRTPVGVNVNDSCQVVGEEGATNLGVHDI